MIGPDRERPQEPYPARFNEPIHVASYLPEGAIPSFDEPLHVDFSLDQQTIARLTFQRLPFVGRPGPDGTSNIAYKRADNPVMVSASVASGSLQEIEAKAIFTKDDQVLGQATGIPKREGPALTNAFDTWRNSPKDDAYALSMNPAVFRDTLQHIDFVFSKSEANSPTA